MKKSESIPDLYAKQLTETISETTWGQGMIVQNFKKQKAKNMVKLLMEDDELLKEFNHLLRQEKLKKIQKK